MKLISFDKIKKAKPKKKAKTVQDQLTKLWFEVQKKKRRNKLINSEVKKMIESYHLYLEETSREKFIALYTIIEKLLFLGKEAKLTSKQQDSFQYLLQNYLINGLESPFRTELKFDQLIPDFQVTTEGNNQKNTKSQRRKEKINSINKELTFLCKTEQFDSYISKEDWDMMIEDKIDIKELFEQKIAPILLQKQKEKLQKEAIENSKETKKGNTAIQFTSVHSLYKKLAKKFHPDLVTHQEEKEERHHLMSVITEAKNKEDIATLLDLYSLHFQDEKIEFKEEESEKLLQLLQNQLEELEHEKDDIIGGPKEHYIYKLFVGKSGSGIEREAKLIAKKEKEQQYHLQELDNKLQTTDELKNILQELNSFY